MLLDEEGLGVFQVMPLMLRLEAFLANESFVYLANEQDLLRRVLLACPLVRLRYLFGFNGLYNLDELEVLGQCLYSL